MTKTKPVTHSIYGAGQAIADDRGYFTRVLDNGNASRVVLVLFDGESEPRRIIEKHIRFEKQEEA